MATTWSRLNEVTSVISPPRRTPISVLTPFGSHCSACCSSGSLQYTQLNVHRSVCVTRSNSLWPASTGTWPKFLPTLRRFLFSHTHTRSALPAISTISLVSILLRLLCNLSFLCRSQSSSISEATISRNFQLGLSNTRPTWLTCRCSAVTSARWRRGRSAASVAWFSSTWPTTILTSSTRWSPKCKSYYISPKKDSCQHHTSCCTHNHSLFHHHLLTALTGSR